MNKETLELLARIKALEAVVEAQAARITVLESEHVVSYDDVTTKIDVVESDVATVNDRIIEIDVRVSDVKRSVVAVERSQKPETPPGKGGN